jgi:hypothetical protein
VLHDYEARLFFRLIVAWRWAVWRFPMGRSHIAGRSVPLAARRKLYLMKNR